MPKKRKEDVILHYEIHLPFFCALAFLGLGTLENLGSKSIKFSFANNLGSELISFFCYVCLFAF